MASTRNKNTYGNYCLEQKQYSQNAQYTLYANSQYGEAYNTRLAGNGLNPGQMPWNTMSNNAPDIETFLFGINSTNLVNNSPPILVPQLKQLNSANIFEKSVIFIPEPLTIEKNQRPLPIP
jgi:hypothetical protein